MSLADLQVGLRSWLHAGAVELPADFDPDAWPGLRVYRNNYRSQLLNCLEQSFPLTLAWMGEEAFAAAAEEHVGAIAPSSWTIDAYAAGFQATLERVHEEDQEIAELAWLEWALAESFISADEPSVRPAELGGVDWDRASLRLQSAMLVREARTNAGAIWSALTTSEFPPGAQNLLPGSAFLVWRSGFEARFRTVAEPEAKALRAVVAGASFGALCARLVADHGEEQGTRAAGELLGRWIADGLVAGVIGPG